MSTLAVGQIRKFTGKYCFPHQLRIDRIEGDRTVVFGNCCGGDAAVEVAHEHATHDLHAETVLISQPIPEPAPELCAQPGCCAGRPVRGPGTRAEHDRSLPEKECCHPFVAPQAKPLIAKSADIYAGPPITGLHRKPAAKDIPSPAVSRPVGEDTEAARGGEAAITSSTTFRRTFREYAPSAVAAAPGIEPWRPSVDDWDLLPDAETGWRR